jgi:hypothetical protein
VRKELYIMKIRLLFLAAIVATSLFSLSARADCLLTDVFASAPIDYDGGTETVTTYTFDCNGSTYYVVVTEVRWPNQTTTWNALELMPNGDSRLLWGLGSMGVVAPWKFVEEDNNPTGDPHNPPGS